MPRYLVALEAGGIMEDPDIYYTNHQEIVADNAEEAEKKYNELNHCSYYYGKVLAMLPDVDAGKGKHRGDKISKWIQDEISKTDACQMITYHCAKCTNGHIPIRTPYCGWCGRLMINSDTIKCVVSKKEEDI